MSAVPLADPANQAVTANLDPNLPGFRNVALMKWYGQTSRIPDSGSIAYTAAASGMRSYGRPAAGWLPAPVRASRSPFSPDSGGPLPTGQTRPYLENCPGAGRRHCGSMRAVSDSSAQVVFLTASQDPQADRCIQRAALWNDQPLLRKIFPSHPETSQPIALSRLRFFSSQKMNPTMQHISPSRVIKSERRSDHGTKVQPAGGLGGLCPPL